MNDPVLVPVPFSELGQSPQPTSLAGPVSPCCCGNYPEKAGLGFSRCVVGAASSVALFGAGSREG